MVSGKNGSDDGLVVRMEIVMSVVVGRMVAMIAGGDDGNDMGFEEI